MYPQNWPKRRICRDIGKLCCDIVAMFVLQICRSLQFYVTTVFCAFFLTYVTTYFENVATELS